MKNLIRKQVTQRIQKMFYYAQKIPNIPRSSFISNELMIKSNIFARITHFCVGEYFLQNIMENFVHTLCLKCEHNLFFKKKIVVNTLYVSTCSICAKEFGAGMLADDIRRSRRICRVSFVKPYVHLVRARGPVHQSLQCCYTTSMPHCYSHCATQCDYTAVI